MSDKTEPSDGMIREAWTRAFPKIACDPLGIINLPSPYAAFIAGYKSASGRAGVATHNTVSREQIAIEAVLELHSRGGAYYPSGEGLVTTEDDHIEDACQYCEIPWPCPTVALLAPTSKETRA